MYPQSNNGMNALRCNIFYSTVFLHVRQVPIRYPNLPLESFVPNL